MRILPRTSALLANRSVGLGGNMKAVSFKRLLITAAVIYGVSAAALFAFQKQIIYAPTVGAYAPDVYGLKDTNVEHIVTPDGFTLEMWSSAAGPGKPTIAFFHGNAGNLAHRVPTLRMFQDKGYGFVALDYRGYGNSTGSPAESALYADARLVLDHIASNLHIDPDALVLYGESLGTGIATKLASERDVAAVILQSPYTSISDAAKHRFFWLPVDLLLTERLSNIAGIDRLNAPLLIMHGEQDELFPVDMAKLLYEKAKTVKAAVYFQGVGHNDLNVLDIGMQLDNFISTMVVPAAHDRHLR